MDFKLFLETLTTDLRDIAVGFGEEYVNDVIRMGTGFAEKMKEDLIRRSGQLASGELTEDEFAWLLASSKDLMEMKALEQKGLATVQLNRIRDAVLASVIKAARKVV